jgi:putative endonuclease
MSDSRSKRDTYTVYMLRCRDGSLYTGIARDVKNRLAVHAAGKGSRYVASRRPFRLVYREPAPSRSAALRREAAIKALPRERKSALVRRAPRRR